VKDQYFTDRRDFFKWEFLEDVFDGIPELATFANLPMWTPPDDSREGQQQPYSCGERRRALFDFLSALRTPGRSALEIRKYFQNKRVAYYANERSYCYASRDEYFDSVPDSALRKALVFFDPDIGLASGTMAYMRRRGVDKYLFDDSVKSVAGRSTDALFIVYQHLQRDKRQHPANLSERCRRLRELVGCDFSAFLHDGEVAFLAAAKQAELRDKLSGVIVAHAEKHGLQCGGYLAEGPDERSAQLAL